MKLIIAGPRDYADYEKVKWEANLFINSSVPDHEEIEIVSCGCDVPGVLTFTREDGSKVYGVDGLGERFAKENGYPVKLFLADWNKHGKAAGPIRNGEAVKYGTHALVLTRPDARGSNNMLKQASKELSTREVKI